MRLIRSMISRVTEDPRTHNLELTYVDEDGQIRMEEFDMVVLSVGLTPHPAAQKLAAVCGIDTDQWGFVKNPPFKMVETSREGIYTCGVFQSPKDIPETVGQASAAAGAAAALLSEVRGTLLTKATYPEEREIAAEEPRIGVFVCHCGVNIAGVIDVAQVSEFALTLPGVVYADHYTFTCATDSLSAMRQVIEEHRLNRVVVASCSPRTHEPLFQDNLRQAGLNKYLFEMANIRDQDSWVHQGEPGAGHRQGQGVGQDGGGPGRGAGTLARIPLPGGAAGPGAGRRSGRPGGGPDHRQTPATGSICRISRSASAAAWPTKSTSPWKGTPSSPICSNSSARSRTIPTSAGGPTPG